MFGKSGKEMKRFKLNLTGSVSSFAILFGLLLGENDHNVTEQISKINEQQKGMVNVIGLSHQALLDDQCGIVHNETTDNKQTQVDVSRKEELGSDEDIDQSH